MNPKQRQKNETFEDYQDRRDDDYMIVKNKLKRRRIIYNGKGPYIKPKGKKKISFTQELRNKKGYAQHLANKGFKP